VKIAFSKATLSALAIPAGRRRITVTDTQAPGLEYELRATGGFFAYRYSLSGRQRSRAIGKWGVISIADARRKCLELARSVSLGEDPQKEEQLRRECPTFNQFFSSQYLPFAQMAKRSSSTDERYFKNHLKPVFGKLLLNQIEKSYITSFLQRKTADGFKPATVNRMLIILRYSLNKAIEWGVPGMTVNPAAGIKTLAENNKIERYLSTEEAERLKAALEASTHPLLKFFVVFLLVTGARRGEALGAKWSDIDLSRGVWRVPLAKSGKARHIVLSDSAIDCLLALREKCASSANSAVKSSPYLFPSWQTGKMITSSLYARWHAARKKAGLEDLRLHDLRHSFASALVNNGVPLFEVQKLLGHASISTTERYAHLQPRRLIESASVAGNYYAGALGARNGLSADADPQFFELPVVSFNPQVTPPSPNLRLKH